MSARVHSPDRRLLAQMRTGLVLLAVAGAFTGCATATRETPRESRTLGAATSGRPTLAELDQQCYAFADRYAVAMSAAVEALTRDEPDVRRIRAAHRLRASGIAGMFDIATGREPFAKAMDLVLVVTLQSRLWIDELGAEKTFGPEKGRVLERALRRLRIDAWRIAERALTPDQLQELDSLILAWRRANPDVTLVAFMRFDEVGASRGRSLAQEVREGGGLLAPVDRAVDVADRARELGERLFWLSKRAPDLMRYQAEVAMDDVLLRPDVQELTRTVVGLPAFIDGERAKVIGDVTALTGTANGLLTQVQGLLTQVGPVAADARAATASVAEVAQTAERLAKLLLPPPGAAPGTAKPFDIAEYTAALQEANRTLVEANKSLATVHDLLSGNDLSERLKEFNAAANERVEQAVERTDQVSWFLLWRGLGFVAGFLVLLGTYRWWQARMQRKP